MESQKIQRKREEKGKRTAERVPNQAGSRMDITGLNMRNPTNQPGLSTSIRATQEQGISIPNNPT
jgi:hypothetical protein